MVFDSSSLARFPIQPGVYLMKDAQGKVIYVGKAKNLRNRVKQYFAKTREERPIIPYLLEEIHSIEPIVVHTEKEAFLLENTLIKQHQPKFNACLKDDKTYISLFLNHTHPWPSLRLVRYKGTPKEKGLYFGPYPSATAAKQTYEMLLRLFPLRQCTDEELKRRTRPCLLYDIKRCIAPCVKKCTQGEYAALVQRVVQFLQGKDKEILSSLRKEMEEASQALDFEQAGALLQMIRHIEHVIHAEQHVLGIGSQACDAIALHREGKNVLVAQLLFREGKLVGSESYFFSSIAQEDEELLSSFLLQEYTHHAPNEILLPCEMKEKEILEEILKKMHEKTISLLAPQKGEKRALVELAQANASALFAREASVEEKREDLLLDLQETLKLERYPKAIFCVDISHLAGKATVGSLIVFISGKREKNRTRTYHVKTATPGDDCGAMREVLERIFLRAKEEDQLPDLLIVDGGKAQLRVALDIFKILNIASVDLIALAKEAGRHDRGMTGEKIFLPEHRDPISLPLRSSLLHFVQIIRDEAHKKAIQFFRKTKAKTFLHSKLDTLPGIGKIKQARLLAHFGSVERIKRATHDELLTIKGITAKDVERIRKL